ncbi:DNA replication complex GINS protein SLD5 [Paramecium bursaria]
MIQRQRDFPPYKKSQQEFSIKPNVIKGVQNQLVLELVHWLKQEICCPEILPYFSGLQVKEDQQQSFKELLSDQSDAIRELSQKTYKDKQMQEFQFITLHVIELERMRYLYHEYHRVRLQKITEHAAYYYKKRLEGNMIKPEREYLKSLVYIQYQHFNEECLAYYPRQMRYIGFYLREQNNSQDKKMKENVKIKKPNKNQILFGKVMTVNNLAFQGKIVSQGDIVITTYGNSKQYLASKVFRLF